MTHLARLLIATCLVLIAGGAALAQELDILSLRHRSAEQLIPALQPLLEQGGTLSGMGNQLFLRASKRNRDDIKRALAALDTPLRRLIIRVSQTRQDDLQNQGFDVSGQVGRSGVVIGTRNEPMNARIIDTRSARNENGSQMVQTVEGSSAFIQVGRSMPVPMRQMVMGPGGVFVSSGVVFRDIGQGFYASPRVSGDSVTVEISQQSDTPGQWGQGSAQTQRLSTTISGRLGEWLELGGTGQQAAGRDRGGISLSTSDAASQRSLWLKVEELP